MSQPIKYQDLTQSMPPKVLLLAQRLHKLLTEGDLPISEVHYDIQDLTIVTEMSGCKVVYQLDSYNVGNLNIRTTQW